MSRLLANSTPADRMRKCVFAEKFDSAANLALNGGAIAGSVTWVNNGLQFNTASSYVNYATRGMQFNYPFVAWCGVIEFTQNFAYNDGLTHYFCYTNSAQYGVYKHSGGNIRVAAGAATVVIDCTTAEYLPYWRTTGINRLAWSCVSGSNYLYLNGTLIKSSATAFTASTPTAFGIGASVTSFTGIMHGCKLFIPQTTAQALTQKDCEVLSAGTTYTYWKNATCIMDGLAANYDIANYRHLDLSGNANHVLLGNGAGTGTPAKLSGQGYSFNGSSQYMTVPLAAWPGTNGTLMMDVSYNTNAAISPRFLGADHTLGANYEHRTILSSNKFYMGLRMDNGVERSAVIVDPDIRYSKIIWASTWGNLGLHSGYMNGSFLLKTSLSNPIIAPDISLWLMRYNTDYTIGTLRSFLAFSRELSSLQIADATLWMQNLGNKV